MTTEGRRRGQEKLVETTIRMPPDLKAEMLKIAGRQKVPLSHLVNDLCRAFVSQRPIIDRHARRIAIQFATQLATKILEESDQLVEQDNSLVEERTGSSVDLSQQKEVVAA